MSASPLPPVHIVGAGPGAPDLLTLRAAAVLQQAEALIWTDSLVNPRIAELAPPGCERLRTSSLTLEEVMEAVVQRARAGLRVVRLHDGDPCLYGAIAEQISRLAEAGLAVEVVPGLSAYQATAAALGSELTVPGVVQTIVLSRAGGRTGVPERESLSHLAALGASLCLYLSARHVEAVEAERCTALHGVPTMFIAELDHPDFPSFDLSSLRTGIMAGAPCPIEVMKRVLAEMHMRDVTIAYGMTETSPVSFQSGVDDPLEKRVSTIER
jgi:precorrin-4 methylase